MFEGVGGTQIKEHPILFKGEMVRAILNGTKTQTRRTNLKTKYEVGDLLWVKETSTTVKHTPGYDGVHDDDCHEGIATISYRADGASKTFHDLDDKADEEAGRGIGKWRPSLFMPRWASRILLEITAIRLEQLQNISEADAKAEGILDGGCVNCGESSYPTPCGCPNPSPDFRDAYCYLWHTINGDTGPNSWHYNPTVKVISFRRITP